MLQWFKVRAPMLALLLTVLGVVLSMYGRITALEVRQTMMEQQLARIEAAIDAGR